MKKYLFPFLLIGVALGQGTANSQFDTDPAKIAMLHHLRVAPVDLTLIDPLLSLLDSKNPNVVAATAGAWSQIFHRYIDALQDQADEVEDDSAKYGQIFERIYEIKESLVKKLAVGTRSSDAGVRLQSVRALCSLSEAPEEIFERKVMMCGMGRAMTMEYKVDCALRAIKTPCHSELNTLLRDPNPTVIHNAYRMLEIKYSAEQLPTIGKLLKDSRKHFQAIGFHMLREAPLNTRIEYAAPFLSHKDYEMAALVALSPSEEDAYTLVSPTSGYPASLRKLGVGYLPYEGGKATQALKQLVFDRDPQVQAEAIDKLFYESEQRDFSPYRHLLDDPEPIVRASALVAAIKSKAPGLRPYVVAGLSSDSQELREAALSCVENIERGADLAEEIIACVQKGVDYVSVAPAFNEPRFAHLLEKCLNSDSANVRKLVAVYMNLDTTPKDVNILRRLANDPDMGVSYSSAYDLLRVDKKLGVAALSRHVLDDSGDDYRGSMAIISLGASQCGEAIPILEQLLDNPSKNVRSQAKRALKELKKSLNP